MSKDYIKFIDELRSLPTETEWIEFKLNFQFSEKIGEYISSLANSASLHQREESFLIFGIDNKTHEVVGTNFNPRETKGKGNEDLEPWLHRQLSPRHDFSIEEIMYNDKKIVIFFIKPAYNGPVKFKNREYIRISSSQHNLSDYPDKEAIIWDRRIPFEQKIAKEDVVKNDILTLLDYDQYYQRTNGVIPQNTNGIIEKFFEEEFLVRRRGKMHITNLGAILFARNVKEFPNLENKAIRIITYRGNNKLDAVKDTIGVKGYASGFYGIINYIKSQIPEPELIESDLRKTKKTYPEEAIREFIANALVHQDFSITGSGPVIEIFANRIEIYNPGSPLVSPLRFMDSEPQSRNEKLTDTLRRMEICEKRGSGVDRAVFNIELMQLPAPKLEENEKGVKVTMYSHKELNDLTKEEKTRACFFHSCVKHLIDHEPMNNSSFCKRLNIETKNQSIASRIIKDTLAKGLIKKFDPSNKSTRYVKYVPFYV